MKKRIAIIDCDPIIHIVSHVQYSAGNRDNVSATKLHARRFLNTILANSNSSHYIMFFQDSGFENFRIQLYTRYKEHRETPEAITLWKGAIIEVLKEFKAHPLHRIESDDAVSIYARATRAPYIVVENDKDMWQIPGIHFNPFKKGLTADKQWYMVKESTSDLVLWSQVIAGDGTDASLDDVGIKGLGAGKPDKSGVWKGGKATSKIYGMKPEFYRAVAAETYMNTYGITEGLRRMALTYDVVYILRSPSDLPADLEIDEAESILSLEPIKYEPYTSVAFDEPSDEDPLY